MRFFSGLYLFYRVVAYLNSDIVSPVFLAILLLGFLSIFHPEKNNLIDSFIFLNLSAISGITMVIQSLLQESTLNFVYFQLFKWHSSISP